MNDEKPTASPRRSTTREGRGFLHVGACILLACLVLGCRSRREEPYSRPPPTPGIGNALLPSSTRSNADSPEPSSTLLRPPDEGTLPATKAAPTEAQAADAGARDFSAELAKLFGDPSGCLAARPQERVPVTLAISLRVQVMPSGSVAHEEVSGAGLDPGEQDCLRRKLENVHFGAPIVNAPFGVSGSVTVNRAANPNAPVAVKNPSQPAAPTQPDQAPPPMNIPTEPVQQSPEPMNIPTEAVQQSPEPMKVPTDPVPQP